MSCTTSFGQGDGTWLPADWVQLLLPITDFLRLVTPRFRQDQRERAAERMRLIAAVAAAAERFSRSGGDLPAGHDRLMESLSALDRCAVQTMLRRSLSALQMHCCSGTFRAAALSNCQLSAGGRLSSITAKRGAGICCVCLTNWHEICGIDHLQV